MGSRMVRNLRHGGHQLVVHDNSISAMEAVCKDGAEIASSPAQMASTEGTLLAGWTPSGLLLMLIAAVEDAVSRGLTVLL